MMLSAHVADQAEREFVVDQSKVTRDIVDLVHKIAKGSATVLILGESGTGKELLARLIHREGGATDALFIAVNLASIQRELTESALFGHERGAFTGAHRQQLGKFELASNGTLFLDEVGDLRMDLQSKLLRAIQEGEIERVGAPKQSRPSSGLIAATNIDSSRPSKKGASARTCAIASTSSRSSCHRCAGARTTFPNSPTASSTGITHDSESGFRASPTKRWRC